MLMHKVYHMYTIYTISNTLHSQHNIIIPNMRNVTSISWLQAIVIKY